VESLLTKIAKSEKGTGKPLVCLHGYGGSVLHWEAVTREWTAHFRVIVPNLTHLYMGTQKLSFSQQIDQVAAFLREMSPHEPVSLVGISYGGALAWGLALQYPELIDKVIFINPMPPFAAKSFGIPSLRAFFALPIPVTLVHFFLSSGAGRRFLRDAGAVFRNLQGEPVEDRIEHLRGRKLKFVSHIFWKFSWILRTERWAQWEQRLTGWKHDCLLVYDRKDPLFNSDFYDGFAKKLAGTNVVVTQEAGHISILQQPKLIGGTVREYLLRDYYQVAEGFGG